MDGDEVLPAGRTDGPADDGNEGVVMLHVTLVGPDLAMLEGIAQTLGALGHRTTVAASFAEAREVVALDPPLVIVADRALAAESGADLLGVPLVAGGARLLFRTSGGEPAPLVLAVQRGVLAELTLPLERHRLTALVLSIGERSRMTGRAARHTPTEGRAL